MADDKTQQSPRLRPLNPSGAGAVIQKSPVTVIREAQSQILDLIQQHAIDQQALRSSKSPDDEPGVFLDILGKLTGYDKAEIPLSEQLAVMTGFCELFRYMRLRAKDIGDEDPQEREYAIEHAIKTLTHQAHVLWASYTINK